MNQRTKTIEKNDLVINIPKYEEVESHILKIREHRVRMLKQYLYPKLNEAFASVLHLNNIEAEVTFPLSFRIDCIDIDQYVFDIEKIITEIDTVLRSRGYHRVTINKLSNCSIQVNIGQNPVQRV